MCDYSVQSQTSNKHLFKKATQTLLRSDLFFWSLDADSFWLVPAKKPVELKQTVKISFPHEDKKAYSMARKCEINLEFNDDIQGQWFSNYELLFRTYSKLSDRNQGNRLYFQDSQIE